MNRVNQQPRLFDKVKYMESKIIRNENLKFEYCIFENSDVFNYTTGKKQKPSKDKRRPNEPPLVYFHKTNDKRTAMYLDQLVAKCFIEGFELGNFIYHKDGNPSNCALDNLLVGNGLKILRDGFGETLDWKLVNIPETKLYFEYYICEDGRLFNGTTGSYVKPFVDKRPGNYNNLRYNLYIGKHIDEIIHYSASRLVALHYIPVHPDDKELVLFKDRDHSNLHYSNLFLG